MNKSQKIVISIISVTLVLLILLGLTYAYFLTQIRGNTNEKSISVTTADLKLEYGDGNGFIALSNVVPNTTITPLVTKTFTVSNKGNVTVDYGVFLEDVINTFERVEDLDLKVECTSSINNKACNGYDDKMLINNDMLFSNSIDEEEIQTFTLTLDYKDNGLDQSVDMNKNVSAKVQIYGLNDTVDLSGEVTDANPGDYIIVSSTPKKSYLKDNKYKVVGLLPEDHTISVYDNSDTLRYSKEITIQKGDNEAINATIATVTDDSRLITTSVNLNKIKLTNISSLDTLTYSIINNALLNKDGTDFSPTPKTKPAKEISGQYESTLSMAEDDLGTSYYFRGNVKNNYVNFANMCWRIVRIEGDGSVKLILEDKDDLCNGANYTGNWSIGFGNFGYDYYNIGEYVDSSNSTNSNELYIVNYLNPKTNYEQSQIKAYQDFQTNTLSNYLNKLKPGNWCYDDVAYNIYYVSESRKVNDKSTYYTNGNTLYYSPMNRLFDSTGYLTYAPTYKCNGTILNKYKNDIDMYVSAITTDELVYLGGAFYSKNLYLFIVNDFLRNSHPFWSMSINSYYNYNYYSLVFDHGAWTGYHGNTRVQSSAYFRPTVRLINNIHVSSGVGIQSDPYVIN